jgi:hypothetical protein
MSIHMVSDQIETALIELEYISADTMSSGKSEATAEEHARVAAYYHAAGKALQVALEIIRQAEDRQNRIMAA